jgi:pimeloyl-ACP methyl ester carboxylesterase
MRTPLEEVWRDTKIPVLYVQGEEDVLVPVENAYALRDRFGGQLEVVVIPHAGHALLPEQPEAVFRTVAAFLREHAITAAACGR